MASKQEIEVKVEIASSEFFSLLDRLCSEAEPTTTEQADVYFSPVDRDFLGEEYPFEWLSVRMRGERILLSYKHFYPEGAEQHTYCDEYEVLVDDADVVSKMLIALGYKQIAVVRKTRHAFDWLGKYEIALDEVDGLGYFVEVEVVQQLGTPKEEREQFATVLRDLGLDTARVELRGYPFMVHARQAP